MLILEDLLLPMYSVFYEIIITGLFSHTVLSNAQPAGSKMQHTLLLRLMAYALDLVCAIQKQIFPHNQLNWP